MIRRQLETNTAEILRRRRRALLRTVSQELGQFNTFQERPVGDLADAAVDEDYGQVRSNLAELESRELVRIDHALERLAAGMYGICEECERPIPVARLKALPYATSCVRCQEMADAGRLSRRPAEHWSRVVDRPEDEPEPPFFGVELVLKA